jgi:glycosyltransferase involved in cell wall biosynthesis
MTGIRRKVLKQIDLLTKCTGTVETLPIGIGARAIMGLLKRRDISYVYARFFNWLPLVWPVFLALRLRGTRVYIEVPTALNLLFREISIGRSRVLQKMLGAFVLLTNAVATYSISTAVFIVGRSCVFLARMRGVRPRVISFANGIDVDEVLPVDRRPEDTIRLIGLGSINIWHGYDRVIKGLARYYHGSTAKRRVSFEVVGDGPSLRALQSLCQRLGLDEHVTFHGMLTGDALDQVFAYADIGIGSIGNHRKGLRIEASLKNREYCSRGIPIVVESEDLSFASSLPWVLRVPFDESPLSIENIIAWHKRIDGNDSKTRSVIRIYAESFLAWRVTYRPVLDEILNAKGSQRL